MPIINDDTSNETQKQTLLDAIAEFNRLTDLVESVPGEGEPTEDIQRQMDAQRDKVRSLIRKNDRLAQVAENHGWNVADRFLDGDGGSNVERDDIKGVPDKGEDDPNIVTQKNDGKNKGGGDPDIENGRFLPGIQGKDFHVVKYNGKTYVVYNVRIGGNKLPMSWRVPENKLGQYGLKQGDGREITRAQFRNLNFFGSAEDLPHRKSMDHRHPFRQWVERTTALYGGTPLLKNKEAMSIFLMGYAEGWSPDEIQGKLRQTKWFQNTTAYSRRWQLELTDKERKTAINSQTFKIKETLKNAYGDNWLKYVDKGKIDDWAEKIASGQLGAMGDPDDAFNLFLTRQMNRAERIEGTPAWVARQQEKVAERDFLNRPEETFEALRQQVIENLGYAGQDQSRMDQDSLQRWANQVASGRKSQADFDQHLRKIKQSLFPYIDPDQSFMDFASPFKSQAESLLGRSLSWDDQLLRDFTKVNANGEPVKDGAVSMTGWDFERAVRGDKRFLGSKTARDESGQVVDLLKRDFFGIGA